MSTLIEQQTAVPAGTWQADTVHSSVGFEVSYLGISHVQWGVQRL